MGKIDVISSETLPDKEDFLDYYLGESAEEAEEVYREFLPLIRKMAGSYCGATNIPYEDLFAEAITGLARAKRDWDPHRSNGKMKQFAVIKIKSALNDYYRRTGSIVSIPYYVKTANRYINSIKSLLHSYDEITRGDIKRLIERQEYDLVLAGVEQNDKKSVISECNKLLRLSINSEVALPNLFDRAEFIPSSETYDEYITASDADDYERERLANALLVSRLEEKMTNEELFVAKGIMAGKSYREIASSYIPPRSIGWVQNRLKAMREKFKGEYEI
jgi:RNA polymerase sigma factor (sigma-70 family)